MNKNELRENTMDEILKYASPIAEQHMLDSLSEDVKKGYNFSDNFNNNMNLLLKSYLKTEDNEPVSSNKDMEKLNIPLPPDDMFNGSISDYKKEKVLKKNKVFKIIIIAAIISVLIGSTLSVQAVRMFIYKLSVQIVSNGISLTTNYVEETDVPENEAYEETEKSIKLKLLKPSYTPENLKISEINIFSDIDVRFVYSNSDESKIIKFSQELKAPGYTENKVYDTENGSVTKATVNGFDITFVQTIQKEKNIIWIDAIWNVDNIFYGISTNLDKSELIKFIKNLK